MSTSSTSEIAEVASLGSKGSSPPLSEVGGCTAICIGGGVDGLITAITLQATSIVDCHIFDQLGPVSDFVSPEVGYLCTEDMAAWAKAHKVDVKPVSTAGRQVLDEEGEIDVEDAKEQQYISWESLYRALRQAFPAENFHQHCKVLAVDMSQPDIVAVELDNGERFTGHLLLAADGVNSGLRNQLLPDCQPIYSGYLAWRGVVLMETLSDQAQDLLRDKSTLFKGMNLHIQVHPLAPSARWGDGTPLAWTWFNNQQVEELSGLMIDREMQIYPYAVPMGHLSRAVADAVSKAADGPLPPILAELIAKSRSCMSVASVTDLAMSCHAMGRLAFVGQSGCVVRPHNFNAVQKAILDATALAEALRIKKLSVEKALPIWDAQQVQRAAAITAAAASAGNRLQGL